MMERHKEKVAVDCDENEKENKYAFQDEKAKVRLKK